MGEARRDAVLGLILALGTLAPVATAPAAAGVVAQTESDDGGGAVETGSAGGSVAALGESTGSDGAVEGTPTGSGVAAVSGPTGSAATASAPTEALLAPFPNWLPAGGLYGREKWVPGSYGVDVFLPRGTQVRAPVAGVVVAPADMMYPVPPPVPAVALRGDSGLSFYLGHVRPLVYSGTVVQAGDPIAVIDDPSFDLVRIPGPGPSGWQHLDLSVSRYGAFSWYGGDLPASPWLQETGYQGTLVDRTPGPSDDPRSISTFGQPAP